MDIFYFYGSIVAGMLLYSNTITIMKKIKTGVDTGQNTFWGCLLVGFIILSIIGMCAR